MKSLVQRISNRPVVIRIADAAVTTINAASERSAPYETGGLLLGWWEADSIVIADALEVVDAAATTSSWSRREAHAQTTLDRFLADNDSGHLGYVGDWHSHPAPVGASGTDLASLARASLQYEHPLALVVRLPNGSTDTRAAVNGRLVKVYILSKTAKFNDNTGGG